MTATIIHFPTLEERDALEFDRFGTSSYTRALDEAVALDGIPQPYPDRSAMPGRLDTFTALVGRLVAGRPDMVDEFVVLDSGALVALREMPQRLAERLAAA